MHCPRPIAAFVSPLALALLAPAADAQTYVDGSQLVPSRRDTTWDLLTGDLDGDGDLDVFLANGADSGNERNRLWINMGGAQAGAPGVFHDQTQARLPNVRDASRGVQLFDLDGDGDLDVYVSNSSAISNQTSRWWINQGGEQGGSEGFFVDETATRFRNLGVNDGATTFSSLAPSHVLAAGGFIDWSSGAESGDLDGDGDLDLFHSSYGSNFFGHVPARVFLNDGLGVFEEFNPSGVQLSGSQIAPGTPAIWCEGVHDPITHDTTGAAADVADMPDDVELADADGDGDLDWLQGTRIGEPRYYQNRLAENGGTLSFRDTSFGSFVPQPRGFGVYELEFGDLDQDGEMDLVASQWSQTSQTLALRWDGTSKFRQLHDFGPLGPSFGMATVDYDADGDRDVLLANFTPLLLRNEGAAGGWSFTEVGAQELPQSSTLGAVAVRAADFDGDGDEDLVQAAQMALLVNVSERPDRTAPRLDHLVQLPARVAGVTPGVVRVNVTDNQSLAVTTFHATELRVRVEGTPLFGPDQPFEALAMTSMGAQVFRGELPGHLLGRVTYRARSRDAQGNAGRSASASFDASGDGGTAYGSSTPGASGTPTLTALSEARIGLPLVVRISGLTPGARLVPVLGHAPANVSGPSGLQLNVAGRPELGATAAGSAPDGPVAGRDGEFVWVLELGPDPAQVGRRLYLQAIAFDGAAGRRFASSRGLEITIH